MSVRLRWGIYKAMSVLGNVKSTRRQVVPWKYGSTSKMLRGESWNSSKVTQRGNYMLEVLECIKNTQEGVPAPAVLQQRCKPIEKPSWGDFKAMSVLEYVEPIKRELYLSWYLLSCSAM